MLEEITSGGITSFPLLMTKSNSEAFPLLIKYSFLPCIPNDLKPVIEAKPLIEGKPDFVLQNRLSRGLLEQTNTVCQAQIDKCYRTIKNALLKL